jgi:hypothetical protein
VILPRQLNRAWLGFGLFVQGIGTCYKGRSRRELGDGQWLAVLLDLQCLTLGGVEAECKGEWEWAWACSATEMLNPLQCGEDLLL